MVQGLSQKISELPDSAAVIPHSALLPVVISGVTYQATVGEVRQEAALSATAAGATNSATLQATIDLVYAAGGGVVQIPAGTFPMDASNSSWITHRDKVYVRGSGMHATVLDFSGKSTYNYDVGMIRLIGAGRSNGVSVTTTVPLGSLYAIVSSVTGYAAGDIVQLRSTETYVVSDGGTRAEFLRVRYVDSATSRVYFTTPTQEPYNTGSGTVTLGKITFSTGGWSDLTIKGKGSNPAGWPTYDPPAYGQWTGTAEVNDSSQNTRSDYGIECIWGRDLVFERLRFVDVENQLIYLQSCYGATISDNSFEFNSIQERSQYAVAIYRGTSNVRISDNFCINCRHFCTTGSTSATSEDYYFGVPHNCTITGNIVLGSWQSGIDMHRSGHSFTITGNVIQGYYTGIKTRAARVTIVGNVCIGPNASEAQASYDGIQSFFNNTDLVISDNKIYGHACGIRVAKPDADFENLRITGNIINDCGAYGIRVTTDAFTGRRVVIDGNTIDSPALYGVFPDGNFEDLSVSGNTINGGTYGIRTPATGTRTGVKVFTNQLRGQTNDPIYLELCTGITVHGNQCYGANTNGVHVRLRDCTRGTVAGNYIELPAGSSGGSALYLNATGSGTCSGLVVSGNKGYAPSSVGGGVVMDDQAAQGHVISEDNEFGAFASPIDTTTDTTTRNIANPVQSVTIASDAVTAQRGVKLLIVDTEGAAATDNLATITYTGRTGDVICVRQNADTRDVTLKDGTGNLRLAGDCVLTVGNDSIMLQWRGTTWSEVCRSINA